MARFSPIALLGAVFACGSVPDDPRPRIFPAAGVIRGTVVYQGPRPCSRNGHIVGSAVVLVFDRRNLPPPNGLANTAVNFGDVLGDVLFANEPRYTGSELYCPVDHGFTDTITVSGPFEIAPMAGGSYELQSFFDYTGDFQPVFKFRSLPEQGDIGGGYVDTADALKAINVGNPNYQPRFLPVEVGNAQPLPSFPQGPPANPIPNYVIPDTGFVADKITVTIGSRLPSTRPYFYPQGETVTEDPTTTNLTRTVGSDQSSDKVAMAPVPGALEDPDSANAPYYEPILTFPQDLKVLAPPSGASPANGNHFESRFPHLLLQFGLPFERSRHCCRADPALPLPARDHPHLRGHFLGMAEHRPRSIVAAIRPAAHRRRKWRSVSLAVDRSEQARRRSRPQRGPRQSDGAGRPNERRSSSFRGSRSSVQAILRKTPSTTRCFRR